MTKDKALDLALEALECFDYPAHDDDVNKIEAAITAIKQVRALDKKAENARELGLDYEPPCKTGSQCTSKCQQCVVQEPVAWMCADESLINKGYARFSHVCMGDWKIPVYTTPLQRTWVGLTKEERHEISMANRPYCADVMAAHEEELKRRNT